MANIESDLDNGLGRRLRFYTLEIATLRLFSIRLLSRRSGAQMHTIRTGRCSGWPGARNQLSSLLVEALRNSPRLVVVRGALPLVMVLYFNVDPMWAKMGPSLHRNP